MTVNATRLQALMRLLDDETPMVRRAIVPQLAAFGDELGPALAALTPRPTSEELDLLRDVLKGSNRKWLRSMWPTWIALGHDGDKLERALSLLAEFQGGRVRPRRLGALLDDLAADYRAAKGQPDPRALATFLFEDRGLAGARSDYFRPEHSDLIAVLESGRGIPISLCLIYMMVGRRLGLDIEGCNFPGHFLARLRDEDGLTFVDCFHGGRLLQTADFIDGDTEPTSALREVLRERPPAEAIVARVLNNLDRAYKDQGDKLNAKLMRSLRRRLEEAAPQTAGSPAEGKGVPAFAVGRLVRHRRYGYRGVVVAWDPECRASDSWYEANRTQPERHQPWYSVLVDGSDQVTYAAQSNLVADGSEAPVTHPLLSEFFAGFEDGVYLRNDRPWPRP
jgi:hemimethylated DNA binding protein